MGKRFFILPTLLFCRIVLAQSIDDCTVYEGLKRDYRPSPVESPHTPGVITPQKGEILIGEIVEKLPEIWSAEAYANARHSTEDEYNSISRTVCFDFYGVQQIVSVPKDCGLFFPEGISESSVDDFYGKLESLEYQLILSDCEKYRELCAYNDWAVLQWVRSLSASVFSRNDNYARELFAAFILNKMGMAVKIARSVDILFLLFASRQLIYSRKYINFDTYRYYFVDSSIPASRISVYRTNISQHIRPLDMRLRQSINFGKAGNSVIEKTSTVFSNVHHIPVNSSMLKFYGEYPQVDLDVYATAAESPEFVAFLQDSFSELKRESQLDALNRILWYLQLDFKYESDFLQFGYEKPFFCEENYVFNSNDCEDRCILMTHIVRSVLGLCTIMIEYPEHIALAVRLDGDIQGDYVRRGNDKFYVCDPSYIGASVGMSIPEYRKQPAKVRVM